MSTLDAYLSLRAAQEGRAVPKAVRRHIHLSNQPLIITGYHLAGDVGAPLALMWGTNRNASPQVAVVPEPRNRQLRFDALADFGYAFVEYLAGYSEIEIERGGGGEIKQVSVDAPQIVVPNRATAEWLFGIVGRFTRHLRTDSSPAAPPIVPLAGKHLSFFHNLLPGSSLVLPVTEALSTHWQTGQLPSEDLNLSALLGWIVPGDRIDGPSAAREGEDCPPAGPLSDPNWDADALSCLIDQWHAAKTDVDRAAVRGQLEAQIREQLNHTWKECWQAIDLLDAIPEGDSVPSRWKQDRKSWCRHQTAMAEGEARFRNIPTPVQSARDLDRLERTTADLQAEMALDDPLVMASYVASGEALSARVSSVDTTRKIPGPRRRVSRPLVILEPTLSFTRPAGTKLFLVSDPQIEFEILTTAEDSVHAQVVRGAVSSTTFSRLPNPGDEVILSPFGRHVFYPPREYDEVPWTHRLPEPTEEQIQ